MWRLKRLNLLFDEVLLEVLKVLESNIYRPLITSDDSRALVLVNEPKEPEPNQQSYGLDGAVASQSDEEGMGGEGIPV